MSQARNQNSTYNSTSLYNRNLRVTSCNSMYWNCYFAKLHFVSLLNTYVTSRMEVQYKNWSGYIKTHDLLNFDLTDPNPKPSWYCQNVSICQTRLGSILTPMLSNTYAIWKTVLYQCTFPLVHVINLKKNLSTLVRLYVQQEIFIWHFCW